MKSGEVKPALPLTDSALGKRVRVSPLQSPMKSTSYPAVLLLGLLSFASTGCAIFTKGKKQEVVVRSAPAAAVTSINGTVVGQTPFRVDLPRSDIFRLDFEKTGFAPQSALLLPSSTEYEERFLRWGLDYDLGAVNDLIPAELFVQLKPALGGITLADRFAEMSAQVVRADALLASGELTQDDHKYLIQQIVATYHPTL